MRTAVLTLTFAEVSGFPFMTQDSVAGELHMRI